MPKEIQQALNWSLSQTVEYPWGTFTITKDMADDLVGKVREYFNVNNIEYTTFSYDDLQPYLV